MPEQNRLFLEPTSQISEKLVLDLIQKNNAECLSSLSKSDKYLH